MLVGKKTNGRVVGNQKLFPKAYAKISFYNREPLIEGTNVEFKDMEVTAPVYRQLIVRAAFSEKMFFGVHMEEDGTALVLSGIHNGKEEDIPINISQFSAKEFRALFFPFGEDEHLIVRIIEDKTTLYIHSTLIDPPKVFRSPLEDDIIALEVFPKRLLITTRDSRLRYTFAIEGGEQLHLLSESK